MPLGRSSWTTGLGIFMNSLGNVDNLNGKQINWYTFWFTVDLRYFWTCFFIRTWRYPIYPRTPSTLPSWWIIWQSWLSPFEWGMTRCLLRLDRSTTGWRFPAFFGNWKSLLKNPVIEGNGQYTYSKAPSSNNFLTSACISPWLWVSNSTGVLVTGVTFPLQPDSEVLVDQHYWEKLARRAPTYGTSLLGGTWSSCRLLQGSNGVVSQAGIIPTNP